MKHLLAAAAISLILAGCAAVTQPTARVPADGFSPAVTAAVTIDPERHPTHPARNRQLVIPSGPVRPELGRPAEMNALFLRAAGEGPHPTLLLLHGLPGNERNLDLAQAVRRAGWNVLTFTYRGAWGSEGTFSIQHAVADTEAAVTWLRSEVAAREHGVDPARIVVGGHSMGGYMAAHAAAADFRLRRTLSVGRDARLGTFFAHGEHPPLAGVILLDAWNIAATARELKAGGAEGRARCMAGFDDLGHALGPITADDLCDNLIRRGEEWDLNKLAPALERFNRLIIYATHGLAAQSKALEAALLDACDAHGDALTCATSRSEELPADHAFADHRIALTREVVRWLDAIAVHHEAIGKRATGAK